MDKKVNDSYFYRLVLGKIKRIMTSGDLISGECRYVFEWDDKKTIEENNALVSREDGVLIDLLNSGVISGERTETNEFAQEQRAYGSLGESWHNADPARQNYYHEVFIWEVNDKKFQDKITRFNLFDNGLELGIISDKAPMSEKSYQIPKSNFAIHDNCRIAYKNTEIILPLNIRRTVAYIMNNSTRTKLISIDEIINSARLSGAPTPHNISDNISRARTAFRTATNSSHDFFPCRRYEGYRFNPLP